MSLGLLVYGYCIIYVGVGVRTLNSPLVVVVVAAATAGSFFGYMFLLLCTSKFIGVTLSLNSQHLISISPNIKNRSKYFE